MRKIVKIYVTVQATSIELAKYIEKHIDEINNDGIAINIEKVPMNGADTESLTRKGINRLPAMEQTNGKITIGITQIINAIKGIANIAHSERHEPIGNNDESISNYWRDELFKYNSETGKYEGREDSDKKEDDFGSIEKRMREYEMNMPKHRRQGDPNERRRSTILDNDYDRGRGRRDNDRDNDRDRNYDEDNIDDRDSYTPNDTSSNNYTKGFSPSDDAHGDELDAKMYDAWINNNPTTID
jgi:hypothetical protein